MKLPQRLEQRLLLSATPLPAAELSGDAGWKPILTGNNFDPKNDTQSATTDVDLLGDATHPLLYQKSATNGTPADDSDNFVAFRVRVDGKTDTSWTSVALIGIDGNNDGKMDIFIAADGTNKQEVAVYDAGASANTSPSTTSLANNPVNSLDFNSSYTNYNLKQTGGDLDGSGIADQFVSFQLPFSWIKGALSAEGISVTSDSTLNYVVLSSQQTNAINGDFAGIADKTASYSSTFAELGILQTGSLTADNFAPVAADDAASATTASNGAGNVLTNDSDPEGAPLSVTAIHAGAAEGAGFAGTVDTALAGTYGSLTLHGDGTYTYAADGGNVAVQGLTGGATLSDSFNYTVSDGDKTDTAVLSVTIGAVASDNQAPHAVDDTGSATEAGGTANATPGGDASGNVLANDSDPEGASLSVTAIHAGATEGAGAAGSVGSALVGAHGSLTLDGDGAYTYVIDNADPAVQALNAGGTLTDSFNYTLSDGTLTDTAVLAVTIHGANDAPVGTDDAGSATEAGGTANATPGSNASGSVLANDGDPEGDALSVTAVHAGGSEGAGTAGSLGTPLAGAYGSLTLNGDGTYSYAVDDANGAVQALGASGTLTDSFNYTLTDGTLTDTAVLTITIHGADDAPVGTDDAGSAAEAGGAANATPGSNAGGNVLSNDGDPEGDSLSVTAVHTGGTEGAGTAGSPGTPLTGTYGSLTLNGDGSYTYAVNDANAAVQALGAGGTLTDSFNYTLSDGALTDTAVLTITIHGANDAPLGTDDAGSATEAGGTANGSGGSNAGGNVLTNDSDPENATLSITAVHTGATEGAGDAGILGTSLTGSYGALTLNSNGTYTYLVDNANAAVQALGAGGTLIDSFNYTLSDGALTDAAVLAITIHGANDAPLGADDSGSATEAGGTANGTAGATAGGNVLTNDSDPEGSALGVTAVHTGATEGAGSAGGIGSSLAGAYGALTLNGDGTYTYVVNDANAAVQALGAGGTLTDSFNYTLSDGSLTDTAVLAIAIHGANDAPVGTNDAGSATEAGGTANGTAGSNATGTVLGNDSDPEADTLSVAAIHAGGIEGAGSAGSVGSPLTGTYGSLTLNGDGTYTYVVDNANPTVQALAAGGTLTESFNYTLSDGALTDTAVLAITIHGANDAPVGANDTGSATEAGGTANGIAGSDAGGNVLTNDSDPEGSALSVTAIHTGATEGAGNSGLLGASLTGTYGALTLASNGSYTYVVDNANAAIQALAVGGTLTDSFNYTLSDGALTDTAVLAITIHGANDAPVGANDTGSATEAGGTANATAGSNAGGNVLTNDSDPDGGPLSVTAVHTGATEGAGTGGIVGASLAGTYGALTLNGDGTYTYAVDNANANVQALGAGGTLTDSFNYTLSDGSLTDAAALTITIHGANDAPVGANDAASAAEAGGTTNGSGGSTANGNVLTNDGDPEGGTLSVTAVHTGATEGAGSAGNLGSSLTGTYGALTLNGDGTYTYVVDNANPLVQALTAGGTLTESFNYTLSDGSLTDTAVLTITINGANDAPVAANDTGSATEAGGTANGSGGSSAGGNVLGNDGDVDSGSLAVTAVRTGGTEGAGLTGSIGSSFAGSYGTLTLAGDGTYTYVVDDANPVVQALGAAGTLTDNFNYTLSDGSLTDTAVLAITIHGANDAPVGSNDAGSATEAGGTANGSGGSNASGDVLANDSDPESSALSVTAVHTGATEGAGSAGSLGTSLAGTYGALTLNGNGTYTYVVDNANAAVQALGVGGTLTDSFNYTLSDGSLTDTAVLAITIHGANDAPLGVNDAGSATEAGGTANGTAGSNASGNVLANDSDTDSGALAVTAVRTGSTEGAGTAGVLGTSLAGSYGTLTLNGDGTYTYLVNNANAAVQALAVGASLTDNFNYTLSDSSLTDTAVLAITVHGANDAPVGVNDAGNATEAGGTANGTAGSNAGGNVLGNDGDPEGAALSVTALHTGGIEGAGSAGTVGSSLTGTYGALTLNGNGAYTYVVDNANAAVQALAAGGTLTDSFNYTLSDGALSDTAVLAITIHGANDAPVGSNDAGSATEAGGTANGTAGSIAGGNVLTNDSDPDSGVLAVTDVRTGGTEGAGTAAGIGSSLAGAYGTLTLNGNGTYSYVVDNANTAVQALGAGGTLTDSFNYSLSDGALTDIAVLAITINGANDAPVAVNDAGSATEAGGTANGTAGSDAGGNVLTNDSDPEGAALNVTAVHTGGIEGAGNAGTVGSALAGTYGSLTLNGNGTYTYVVDNANPVVQALGAGGTLTESFNYAQSDGALSDTAVLTITINGADDAPVAANDTGSATEAGGTHNGTGGNTANGNVLANDSDPDSGSLTVTAVHTGGTEGAGAAGSVGSSLAGTYGRLTLISDGTYTYAVDNASAAVQALAPGGTLTDSFNYTLSDGSLADTAVLTITIHGANDAPVASDDVGTAIEAGGTANGTAGSDATGSVLANDTDPDGGALSVTTVHSGATVGGGTAGIVGTPLAGSYGALTLNGDGTYTYVVDNANTTVQALGAGGTLTDSFNYMVSDGSLTDTAVLTVTINGANDAPVAADDADGARAGSNAGGNVLANDRDPEGAPLGVTAIHTGGIEGAGTGGSLGIPLAGAHGALTLNSDGTYTYVVDNADPAVVALGAGATLTDSFNYTASDGALTDAAVLTITINSANAPGAANDTASATEAGGTLNTTPGVDPGGDVFANDSDPSGGPLSVIAVHLGATEGAGSAGVVGSSLAGAYGALTLNGNGTYAYLLDNANPVVEALGAGDTLTETFNYTMSDGALSDTAVLTITIHGANDAPVAVNDVDNAIEAGGTLNGTGGSNANGNVLTNDSDAESATLIVTAVHTGAVEGAGAAGSLGSSLSGAYGALTLDSSGAYTYAIDNANAAVQALGAGGTLTDSFNYDLSDGSLTDTATLTVTIHGAKDAPVAVNDAGSATEAGGTANGTTGSGAGGNVLTNDSDVDSGVLTVTAVRAGGTEGAGNPGGIGSSFAGSYGTLTLNADGSYAYAVDNANAAVEALGTAGTLTDRFNYTVSDGALTDMAVLAVTIHGANDAPVAANDTGSAAEAGGTANGTAGNSASGNVLVNDSDVESAPLSVTAVHTGGLEGAGSAGTLGTSLAGAYGALTLNSDGTYAYVVDNANAAVQALAAGGTVTDSFNYTASDGALTDIAVLAITIHGANDAPVAANDAGSATEAGGTLNGTAGSNAGGDVFANDSDADGGPLSVTAVHTGATEGAGTGGIVGSSLAGSYGALTLNSNGTYTYVVDNANVAVQALAVGGTLADGFNYTVSDGSLTDTAVLTVTIHGADDAPTAANDAGSATEAGGTGNATPGSNPSGNVITNDRDAEGAPLSVTAIRTGGAEGAGSAGSLGAALAGSYGTLTLNGDGTYSYVVDNANAAVQALGAAGTLADSFNYTLSDGGLTDTAVLTITVHGANDAPVATNDAGAAAEAGGTANGTAGSNASGNVLANDNDPEGAQLSVTAIHTGGIEGAGSAGSLGSSLTGTYGSLTLNNDGSYTYVVDNANAAVQALAAGSTLTDNFNYTLSDGALTDMAVLAITINGANDAPVGVNDAGSATEAGGTLNGTAGSNASGNVLTNDGDPESAPLNVTAVHTGAAEGAGTAGSVGSPLTGAYGSLTLDSTGAYTYVVNDASAAVQALGAGGTLTDSFNYTLSDGSLTDAAALTITIHGANDAPVGTNDAGSATEAGGTANGTAGSNANGNVLANDSDAEGGTLNVSAVRIGAAEGAGLAGSVGSAMAGTYGALTLNGDGTYTYVVDNANPFVEALSAGDTLTESFNYTLSDGSLSDTAALTITIHGAKDAPAAGNDAGSATEAGGTANASGGSNATGDVLANDTDPDSASLTVTAVRIGGTEGAGAAGGIGSALAGSYGSLTLDSHGGYAYVVDNANAAVQALGVGGTLTESFNYTVSDGSLTDMAVLAITINGTNDAPVAANDSANESGGNASGNVLSNDGDPDGGALSVASVRAGGTEGAGSAGSIGSPLAGAYGTLTLNSNGTYAYVVDTANAAVQALAVGGTLTEHFNYSVSDGSLTDTAVLAITVNGTDDPPVGTNDAGAAVEAGGTFNGTAGSNASGNVLANDYDPEGAPISVTAVHTGAVEGAGSAGSLGSSLTGSYGALTLSSNGSYTYVVDNANAAVQALAVGSTLTDSFNYKVSDGGLTDTAVLTITINGADDAPVGVNDTASATEASGTANATPGSNPGGNVLANDSDLDGGPLSVAAIHTGAIEGAGSAGTVGTSLAGSYGALTLNGDGTYTYLVDNANAAVQALAAGGTLTDSFNYTLSDGALTDTALLAITIHGANDAPVGTDDAGSATEAGGTANGTAGSNATGNALTNDSDPESSALSVTAVHTGNIEGAGSAGTLGSSLAGTYGSLTLNSSGAYTYVVNNANAAVQALAIGGSLTDSFNYTLSDGSLTDTAVLAITIHGANDAPVGTNDAGSATEAGGTANGTAGSNAGGNVLTNDSDPDSGALAVSAVRTGGTEGAGTAGGIGSSLTGTYGSLTLAGDGTYIYVVNDASAAVQALGAGGTLTDNFNYTLSDGSLSDTAVLAITIHGANDAPVGTNDAGSATEAGGTLNGTAGSSAGGNVLANDSDPESSALSVTAIHTGGIEGAGSAGSLGSSLAGSYGALTLASNGTYTYVVDNANAAVQALGAAGTLTDSFNYTLSDGSLIDTAVLTITVHGANDAPVGVNDTGSATEAGGTGNGAGGSNATGNVLANDTDAEGSALSVTTIRTGAVEGAGAAGSVGSSLVGSYGALTLNGDGTYTYVIDNANAAVQALGVGGTLSDSFNYKVSDGSLTDTAVLTITINGANDAPVGTNDAGSATEAGGTANGTAGSNATGNVLTNDSDPESSALSVTAIHTGGIEGAGSAGSVGSSLTGSYGALTLNVDGTYAYAVDNANAAVQALGTGGTLSESFNYTVSDGSLTDSAVLAITIHGANDAPVGTNDTGSATEAGGTANGTAGSNATGNVLTNDGDAEGSALSVTAIRTGGTEGAGSAGTVASSLTGSYGALTLNSNGTYTYLVDNANAAVQALGAGGTLTESFNYTLSDGTLTDAAVLAITIHGANDAPVGTDDTGSATEAGGTANATAGSDASGNVLTNDTDAEGAALSVTAVHTGGIEGAGSAGSIGSALIGSYGALTLNGDGTYTYAVDNANAAVQALGVGGSLSESFNYTLSDGGLFDTAVLAITIHGANDAPVAADDAGSATEAGGTANGAAGSNATGNVLTNDSDPDGGLLGVTAVHVGATEGAGLAGGVGASLAGTHGALTLNSDGTYTYAVNNADLAVQGLNAGDTLTDSFNYTTSDGALTDTAVLTITVHGANDAPMAANDAGSAAEAGGTANGAGGSNATGNVLTNDSDPEGAALSVTAIRTGGIEGGGSAGILGSSLSGSYGALTLNGDGTYTYVVDNANMAVQALAAGGTLTDSFNYTLSDGSLTDAAVIAISIHGANDAPVAANDAGSATEAGGTANGTAGSNASGNVLTNDSDPEGAALSVTAVHTGGIEGAGGAGGVGSPLTGTYGALTLNSDGTYTYAVDNANAAVQALAAGGTLTDSFNYTASDGSLTDTAVLAITVHGANDAPVAANDAGSATEAAGTANGTAGSNATGNVLANDGDPEGTALSVTAVHTGGIEGAGSAGSIGSALTGAYGALTLNGDGTYTYLVDNANAAVQALAAGGTLTDSFNYTASDGSLTDTAVLAITVHGANDAPVAANDAGSATEAGGTANGTPGSNAAGNVLANDSDPEGATLSVTAIHAGAAEGAGTAGSLGAPLTGTYGSLTLASNGAYTYVVDNANATVQALAVGATLTDSFNYTASDGALSDTAVLAITVHGANDAPVGAGTSILAPAGHPVSGFLPAAVDPDAGDVVAYAKNTDPAHGSVVVHPDGSYSYTTASGYGGTDSFTFTVSDGHGGTATYTVDVVANRPPSSEDGSLLTAQDVPKSGTLPTAADPDGDALTYAKAADPAHGTVTVHTDGTYIYTPAPGYVGADSFGFTVSDGNGGTTTHVVSATVDSIARPISPITAQDPAMHNAIAPQESPAVIASAPINVGSVSGGLSDGMNYQIVSSALKTGLSPVDVTRMINNAVDGKSELIDAYYDRQALQLSGEQGHGLFDNASAAAIGGNRLGMRNSGGDDGGFGRTDSGMDILLRGDRRSDLRGDDPNDQDMFAAGADGFLIDDMVRPTHLVDLDDAARGSENVFARALSAAGIGG